VRLLDRPAARFVPVGLLVLGIAVQGVRIVALQDDPQQGTAFAMFATVDIGTNRRVVATVPGDPDIRLEIPPALEERRDRLADTPTDAAASELAAMLLDQTWTVEGETATAADGSAGDEVDAVRVQVVGLEADGRTITRQVLADEVVNGLGS